jgi:predicted dehydrogenase
MAASIPAAIVGLGRIGCLLEDDALREKPCTHAGAIAADPCLFLAAGCDTDSERRGLFAARWDAPAYTGAEEMLAAHQPQVLHIATHPDSHLFYCRLAAKRRVPVVVCEKPLAGTLHDARRIAALHRSGAVKILTNHERRYAADYTRARDILAGGRLGAPLSARAALYMGRNRRLGKVLWHDGTHLADALMFLSGAVLRHERAWGANLRAGEGSAWLAGRLENSGRDAVPVMIELGAGRDHLVFEIEFSCSRGRLRIGNGVFEIAESAASPYAENFNSLKTVEEGFEGPTGYFSRMAADAAACVKDPARQPVSSALDGLRAVEYLHSVCGRMRNEPLPLATPVPSLTRAAR